MASVVNAASSYVQGKETMTEQKKKKIFSCVRSCFVLLMSISDALFFLVQEKRYAVKEFRFSGFCSFSFFFLKKKKKKKKNVGSCEQVEDARTEQLHSGHSSVQRPRRRRTKSQ